MEDHMADASARLLLTISLLSHADPYPLAYASSLHRF